MVHVNKNTQYHIPEESSHKSSIFQNAVCSK